MSFIGLSAPVNLIEYQGTYYKLAPLSFKEMAEYVLWYQYSELERQQIVTKPLPSDVRDRILLETHEKCRNKVWRYTDEHGANKEAPLSWETPVVQESCNTLEGIREQIYLSLKVNHPEMTKDLACKIVTIENYQNLLNRLMTAMGIVADLYDETKELAKKLNPNQTLIQKIKFKSRLIGIYFLGILSRLLGKHRQNLKN
jgi:hypothetical protein